MNESQIQVMISNIEWLQCFYLDLCDGDWEHSYGFKIDTLDNPGWILKFDMKDTPFEGLKFDSKSLKRNEYNWIDCKLEEGKFIGGGGALNLDEIIGIFRKWIIESGIEIPPLESYEKDPFIPKKLREFVKKQKKSWRDEV